VVFLLVKAVNRARDAVSEPEAPAVEAPAGPTEIELLIEIRDSLRK
jgi:large conductance mechanosensitive channel